MKFLQHFLPFFVLLALSIASLCTGNVTIDWHSFFDDAIIHLRLGRILSAWVIGAALAVSGLIFQAILRNPLAEPFTLGISGGAGLGAALAILLDWALVTQLAIPGAALAGALAVLLLVIWCSHCAGGNGETLLLSGVIAGTIASSALVYLLSIADHQELAGITWWMLGDLQAVDPGLLGVSGIIIVILLCSAVWHGKELNALALGEETAWNMGVAPRKTTVLFVIIGALLTSCTVAMAGIIAFAGLIVPHVVRLLYGCDHRKLILPAALWGSSFLVLCDWLSRILDPMRELPIGVLTSAIGGPVFLVLLIRNHRRRRHEWQ